MGLPREQGWSQVGALFRLESAATKAIGEAAGTGPPLLPEDDSLLPGSAKLGMTQPDLSQSLGGALHSCSSTAVKPELSQARPAQALASERVLVYTQPRVSRNA